MTGNFFLKVLLFPVYILFNVIVWVKNKLFDYQILKSTKPSIYTINVGNLAVGGTGKTPMVEYLVSLFQNEYSAAILSRGYGRKTKGFFQANASSNANNIGDEPFQYSQKFGDKINVFVGENRVEAYKKIIKIEPKTKLLLLDDAFQHRKISAHLNIILTDYNNLIYNDLLLPIGRLREPISSLKRANILIITKCPASLPENEANKIESVFRENLPSDLPIFFTTIQYEKPFQFNGKLSEMSNEIIIATGLANSKPFQEYCKKNWSVKKHFEFADHYDYKTSDIENITSQLAENESLLVTEKDFVKLNGMLPESISAFYLPIKVSFLFNKTDEFNSILGNSIKEYYKN
jgi:tetraacyldisaccharide 4'-kinase